MRETAEQLLIAWLHDYAAAKRGESGVLANGAAADGRAYLHGHHPGACAAIFVHPSGAVAPVIVGAHDPCLNACFAAQLGKLDVADGGRFPRPAVRIDGIDRHFRHVAGRRVVGVIEDSEAFLLLGYIDSGWAVAYVEPGRAEWLATFERPGTINLDTWRALHPRPSPPEPPPEPPAPAPAPSRPPAPQTPTPEPPRAPAPPTPEPPRPPAPPTPTPEPPRSPATPLGAHRTSGSDRRRVRLARTRTRLHIRTDLPPPHAPPARPTEPSPPTAEPPPPSPPPDLELLAIARLHERVLGVVVDDERSAAGQVLLRGLEIHVSQAAPVRRSRLPILVRGIVAFGRKGVRSNPAGTRAQLAEVFSQLLGQRVSPVEIGEALIAAREEGWDFVELNARTYTLHLSELLDIRSALHHRFVERCILAFDLRGVEDPPAAEPPPATGPAHAAVRDWRPAQAMLIVLAMLVSDLAGRDRPEAASQAVAAVQAERDEVRADVDAMGAELAAMKAERDGAQTDVAALRTQLAAMKAERDEARTALAARDAQLVAVQAERDEARATLADREAQLAAQRERDQAQDVALDDRAVVADRDEAQAVVAERDRELAAALAEQGKMRAALDEALAERDDVRRTLAAHEQRLAALHVERDEARSTLAEREAEIVALRGELTLRDEQMERLEARVLRVEAARASQFALRSGAPPGDLHAGRSSVAAHASALLSPPPAISNTTAVEPRGARGPPDDAGPR